jgi:hypothetical protein
MDCPIRRVVRVTPSVAAAFAAPRSRARQRDAAGQRRKTGIKGKDMENLRESMVTVCNNRCRRTSATL